MVNTRNSDAASQQPHLRATRRTPTQYSEAGKDAGSKGSAKQAGFDRNSSGLRRTVVLQEHYQARLTLTLLLMLCCRLQLK